MEIQRQDQGMRLWRMILAGCHHLRMVSIDQNENMTRHEILPDGRVSLFRMDLHDRHQGGGIAQGRYYLSGSKAGLDSRPLSRFSQAKSGINVRSERHEYSGTTGLPVRRNWQTERRTVNSKKYR
jgi:hypothetical protein